jgi:hypothetical protein
MAISIVRSFHAKTLASTALPSTDDKYSRDRQHENAEHAA